jgi:hypothetical protein
LEHERILGHERFGRRAKVAVKRSSMSVTNAASNAQLDVICQDKTSRPGGSHTSTRPTSHSVPSSDVAYQRLSPAAR